MFEPDALMPSQFFTAFRRNGGIERERLLMLAVLEDAVGEFQKYAAVRRGRGRILFVQTEGWLFSEDRSWPFSCASICDTLEINHDYILRGLSSWKARARASWGLADFSEDYDIPQRTRRKRYAGLGRHKIGKGAQRMFSKEPTK